MPSSFLADLRGGARLAVGAVTGVTSIAEAVHATVSSPLGRPRRARGVAGWVYRAVRGTARSVGHALDASIGAAERVRRVPLGSNPAPAVRRDAAVAALNGAFGDLLVSQGNALAIPLEIRLAGRPLPLDPGPLAHAVEDPSDALLLLVHGLCMHDGQWGDEAHDPGAALAEGLGATLLTLRYNSGRHISQTGRDLAGALDALVTAWPREVRRVVVVGHSMGGLVSRSAFHHGAEAGHTWVGRDATLVTLGSPHHGAPLERVGNVVDRLLATTRWTAPFARIGQARSAGVTDLRFGNVRDEDWADRRRFSHGADHRQPLPLPHGVACYAVAATIGTRGRLRDATVGDGLVPLESALGRHVDPDRDLRFPPDRTWVARGMTHFDLLRRPEVTARLLAWLAPPPARLGGPPV